MNRKVIEFRGTLADYFNEQNDMDKLINILKGIENSEFELRVINNIIEEIQGDSKDIVLIQSLAEDLLIANNGACNWQNINKLKEIGFDVYAGDSDSFGWLTGCIETKKGIVVYG